MKSLVLLLATVALTGAFRDYSGYKILEVTHTTDLQRDYLVSLESELNFWTAPWKPTSVVIVPGHRLRDITRQLGARQIRYEILVDDVNEHLAKNRAINAAAKKSSRHDWTAYSDKQGLFDWLDEIIAEYDFVTPISIGTSTEGEDLRLVSINPGGATKKIWIDAGIHAREWISPAAATYIINELTVNYEANKELADAFDWYIMPLDNPDGYQYSWDEDRYWRKTRSDHGSIFNCRGVDPNRNWDYHWNEIGSSDDKCSEIYSGPSAFSEPETLAMSDFIKALNADDSVQIYFTLHSYSQVVVSPWSYTSEAPEDFDEMEAMGEAFVQATSAVHGKDYIFSQSTQYFGATAGSSDDWAKGGANIQMSYTVEMRPEGFPGFELPPDEIIPASEEIWAGIQAAARMRM